MKTTAIYASVLSALLVGALALPSRAETPAPQEAKDLATANNQFGIELLQKIHKKGGNTFISPASIGMALQMTSRGAKGDTLDGMNRTMHVEKLDVGDANRKLIDALSGRDDVKLNLANSIWVDPKGITLKRKFADDVQAEFDAEIRTEDFQDPKTREVINEWVSERTEEMIPELLKEPVSDSVCILVNAIYFKGEWTRKFDKANTKEADFTLADGSTRKVQMMKSARNNYDYFEDADVQVVALPYGPRTNDEDEPGAESNMHMWVVLPRAGKNLDDVVADLKADSLSKWRAEAGDVAGTVSLPRFKTRFGQNLNQPLIDLGMGKAFTSTADFSGFEEPTSRANLFIGAVIHEAVIVVNEEGTEAAAATAVKMTRSSAQPRSFEFTCDRPFMLAITDDVTGSILFIGAIHNPESE